jgi:hypothetical protein
MYEGDALERNEFASTSRAISQHAKKKRQDAFLCKFPMAGRKHGDIVSRG